MNEQRCASILNNKNPYKQCRFKKKKFHSFCGIHLRQKEIKLFKNFLEEKVIIIQSTWRGYLIREIVKDSFKKINKKHVVNQEDIVSFITLDKLRPYYLSIYTTGHLSYVYDIRSLKEMFEKKYYLNPFTRINFDFDWINNIIKRLRFLHVYKLLNNTNDINELEYTIKQKTVDIFQLYNELGHFINHQWFLDLDLFSLKKLYLELKELWTYRCGLSQEIMNNIVSDIYLLSKNNNHTIKNLYDEENDFTNKKHMQHILLEIYRSLATEGSNREYKILGSNIALTGLTIVSLEAREALPYLYQEPVFDEELNLFD